MLLTCGSIVGPYEILSALGAGNMGDVWKARDTRLNRIVAIKTLKGPHTGRFEQEARAIALRARNRYVRVDQKRTHNDAGRQTIASLPDGQRGDCHAGPLLRST